MRPTPSDRLVRVLVASPLEPAQVDRIRAVEPDRVEVVYAPEMLPAPRYANDHGGIKPNLSPAQRRCWQDLLAEAEVCFDFDWEDPSHLLDRAPKLRWIQATSAGIGEYVQRIGLPRNAICLTTAAGVHAQALAEFAILGMLYFARGMPVLRQWQVERHWERFSGRELHGSTACVLGLGKVGRRVAELASAMGVVVLGHRRSESEESPAGVTRMISGEDLDNVLRGTDHLVIATPYTPETHHLIDARRLALLPDEAVIVNVGRGKVVDEAAMIEALRCGKLAGAALDVFEREPLPSNSPLWDLPNVIVSPHSASTVRQENERIVDLFIDNLRRYLDGRPLINAFDYDRGY